MDTCYFIEGTSSVILDNENVEMVYAVFTTPENSIGASAVCAFSLSDIVKVFDGPFKGQSSYDSNWLPVPASQVPTPRPGACHQDSSYLPDAASVAFHKAHPLMDASVQGVLTLVFSSNDDRFRVVEVEHSPEMDPIQAPTPYHILYIGTESGKVLKTVVDNEQIQNVSRQRRLLNRHKQDSYFQEEEDPSYNLNSSLISASWQIADKPIKTLRLINPRTLLVGTETEVFLIPTSYCEEYKKCGDCIRIKDPHCYWDMNNEACVSLQTLGDEDRGQFDLRQDIQNGDAQFCPQGK